eukprot:7827385-Ditylum_brightwellii.AAC.1
MQKDEDALNDLGVLHVPDINDNEINEILNLVDDSKVAIISMLYILFGFLTRGAPVKTMVGGN